MALTARQAASGAAIMGAGLLVAVLSSVVLGVGEAAAQSRCRVMDPTGTDLNVRATPNGRVMGRIVNGTMVSLVDTAFDDRGRPWARVIVEDGAGRTRAPGWVFREFVACW